MKNNKIISIIQIDSPLYVNTLLSGMSSLYSYQDKNTVVVDIRSVKSDILWSVYGKENIKYIDEILNVGSSINTQMLKTYLDSKSEILCVRDINNILQNVNINYFFECLASIYDNIILVIQDKSVECKKFVLGISDIILFSFIKEPTSFENCKNLYLELSTEKTKEIRMLPVMFDIETNYDFDNEDYDFIYKELIVLPLSFKIKQEVLNANFLFNDKSNAFVKALDNLIEKISKSNCIAVKKEYSPCDPISKYKEIKSKIHKDLIVRMQEYANEKDQQKLRNIVEMQIEGLLKFIDIGLSFTEEQRLTKELSDEILGLGVLEDFLNDNEITEIMVNGCQNIYVEKNGKLQQTEIKFQDTNKLRIVIDRIASSVGRHIDEASPIVDARLQDGSRVNAVIAPIALNGPILTIRKFAKHKLSADDIISYGSANIEMINFLTQAVKNKQNILISGGTGTGKTTLLNVISSFISDDERIITIEDSAELQLQQKHVIRLETRTKSIEGTSEITIRQLVVNALRMRPDRIIVGECRSGETLDMLQAMNTGHNGSMTTVHSNSCKDAISRLLVMVIMAGVDLPEKSILSMIYSAINIIVQIKRFPDGSRKISEISLLQKSSDNSYELVPAFQYDIESNTFKTLLSLEQGCCK
ncbi:MAG: CpaF family protein [Endomicrobiia bacterium]|nr:CpaF family protein [Endomicrobiaceae bacterium]MDD3053407.1 CpaF family protein [Endomicrobiaceae bacterium]MDD3922411.1 CpaF family protein [Endomicrobiaceae bacterium]MDD5102562.1 CpaF family protein [Endomicrobiaceae bacterium]